MPELRDAFASSILYCGGFKAQHIVTLLHGQRRLEGAVEVRSQFLLGLQGEWAPSGRARRCVELDYTTVVGGAAGRAFSCQAGPCARPHKLAACIPWHSPARLALAAYLHAVRQPLLGAFPPMLQVIPGICLGAHEAAVAEVVTGGLQQTDFRFFAGCLAWEPGQLQREIAAGAWHTAACSRSLVLKQCLQVGGCYTVRLGMRWLYG